MPVSWIFALVCMGCSEPSEQILRGHKHAVTPYKETAVYAANSAETATGSLLANDQEGRVDAVELRRPLNLALPEELLEDNSSWQPQDPFPNLFGTEGSSRRLNLSGSLYWDETEQAEEVPILESINGAGLEIQILTP